MLGILPFFLLFVISVQADPRPSKPYKAALRTSSGHRTSPLSATTLLTVNKAQKTPNPKHRFLSTYTDNGKVFGCTALATLSEDYLTYAAGDVNCAGKAVPIATAASSSDSEPSKPATEIASGPVSGCTAVASNENKANSYCQCDNGEYMPRNLYTDGMKTAEVCDKKELDGKRDWFEVPKAGPLAPWMAELPDDDPCMHPKNVESMKAECWGKLHLTEYIQWWWGTFNSSCTDNTPFGNCFLNLMFGSTTAQCANITTSAACPLPQFDKSFTNWNSVRNFYVGYTIWNMNQFLTEYWQALDSAKTTIHSSLLKIKEIIDPPDPPPPKKNVVLDIILSVLSIGLAFLPPPLGQISSTIVKGVEMSNGMKETFFPSSGGFPIPEVPYNEVEGQLDDVVKYLRQQIQDGCYMMLNDADVFVAFGQGGGFLKSLPALLILTQALEKRFNTFMVAQALTSIGIIIGRAEKSNIQAIQASQKLSWKTNCTAYDDNNICDTYWYDKESGDTYSLLNPGDNKGQPMGHSFNGEMMNLFPEFTTPEELFRESWTCNSTGAVQDPSLELKKGKAVANCMANMMVCTWEQKVGGKYDYDTQDGLFKDCTASIALAEVGKPCTPKHTVCDPHCRQAGGEQSGDIKVPRGYMGWGMYSTEESFKIGGVRKLHILEARIWGSSHETTRGLAILHALHRAIITSPNPLPDIEFSLSVSDIADPDHTGHPIWALTRRPEQNETWIMSDFGYWSWPMDPVGECEQVRREIRALEADEAFAEKKKQVVWRGATKTNRLRDGLLRVTAGQEWADVEAITWSTAASVMTQGFKRILTMPEHCQYQFTLQTEGRSYSGRGKYLHNCHSVVMIHKRTWIEPHHTLLVPSGPKQNFVEVESDFSDLHEKVQDLLSNPAKAAQIAQNNVDVFRDRYLTPAAQTCYWRSLIRAWANVSPVPVLWEPTASQGTRKRRGVPFETFVIQAALPREKECLWPLKMLYLC